MTTETPPDPKPPFECVISADLFRRANTAKGEDGWRQDLCGVHVTPSAEGGVIMVATDGRRMLVIRDENALIRNGSATVSLTPAMVRALSERRTKTAKAHFLAVRGTKAAVIAAGVRGATTLTPEAAEGFLERVDAPDDTVIAYQWARALTQTTFPNWRRVVLSPKPDGVISSFNPTLAAPMAVALDMSLSQTGAVRLVPTGDDPMGPILMFPAETHRSIGFGIIMPVRTDDAPKALPSWLPA